jgi:hypothetical protein
MIYARAANSPLIAANMRPVGVITDGGGIGCGAQ